MSEEKREESFINNPKVDAEGQQETFQDAGAQVLAAARDEPPATPQELKKLVRKIDFVLMPLMVITYGLNYTDKNLLSTAINFGASSDLDLFYTENGQLNTGRYSNATTIYYVGFVCGAPIGAFLAQRFRTGRVCSIYVFLWGLACMSTAWCTSYPTTMVQRTILGLCEAGVQPCFILLIGAWYTKHEQVPRHSIWWMGAGGSIPITVAVNYGLLHLQGAIAPWRNMFYCWGVVTMVFGVLLFFFLPDSPVTAWMLTPRQRYLAVERLRINQSGIENRHFKKEQVWEAITDFRVIAVGLMQFAITPANSLSSAFSQILFKQLLKTSAYRAMVLSIPTGMMLIVILLIVLGVSLRFRNCLGLLSLGCQSLVLLGAILLWVLPSTNEQGLFAGIYLMSAFLGAVSVNFGLATANVAGHTKKTICAAWLVICTNAANAAGPKFFLATEAPKYTTGFIAITICAIGSILITIAYIYTAWRENKRRDALGEVALVDRAFRDLTDKQNLSFRYSI